MNLSEVFTELRFNDIENLACTGISIDSRNVRPGEIFIALRGERFDGHEFAGEAVRRGAVALMLERRLPELQTPQLIVQNTLETLTLLATTHRKQFTLPVIALTGSNGKTTVKEMIAAILPKPAHATHGNLNNHIGVPLSVLALRPEHRYAVFELGANHPLEIAHTVAIVKPSVTLINNIAPAHVAGFGSLEGVATAKGEIHQGLTQDGIGIVNDDDAFAHFWDKILAQHRVLRFSKTKPSDIYARAIQLNSAGCARFILVTPHDEGEVCLRVPGIHHVSNALAASAAAISVGIPLERIIKALKTFEGVPQRLMIRTGPHQSRMIDDTYNANLTSVLAAIEVLVGYNGRRIFVFGDMGELGAWTTSHHETVGRIAAEKGIEYLMTCGAHSQVATEVFNKIRKSKQSAEHYSSQDAVVSALLPRLDTTTTVLFKGSRGSKIDNIVSKIIKY